MTTLVEIEKAAAALPPKEKQELLLFLVARLRSDGARPPEPRLFSKQQINAWISEDEAEMRRFESKG